MEESPITTLQASSGDAEPVAARFTDPVAEVEKLLNPEPAPVEPSPETDIQAEPPGESWDLKSVAEKLQTDPSKLYEGLKVALDDGTEISVSALKDAHRPVAELEKARAALLEEHTSSKRDVMQASQELMQLLQTIPAEYLNEGTVRGIQQQAQRQRDQEAARLLERVPEWKDPIAKAADWSDIRRVAKEVGYTDAEIRLAEEGYADHRMVATLRLLAKGPKAPAAKPAPKVAAKPAKATQSAAQQFGHLKASVTTRRISPEVAVETLLRGR